MRNLARNEIHMWYALYVGKTRRVDENGDFTGEYVVQYSKPVSFWAIISPGRGYNAGFAGTLEKTIFGVDLDSERRIMTAEVDLPVSSTSLIWLEPPGTLQDGTADPDTATFSVTAKPAKGPNFLAIPVKERLKDGNY